VTRTDVRPIRRVLLLGGTSEIGLATLRSLRLGAGAEVILAGRDASALAAAARSLPATVVTSVDAFDALDPDSALAVVRRAFDAGPVDVVLPAFGVLGERDVAVPDPAGARDLLTVNVVAQSMVVLEAAARLRRQGHGCLVVFSSIAAVRPRKANYLYGAGKSALDALAEGLSDAVHGTGVRVVVVRPGFVTGRMTTGLRPAPFATTPATVGAVVAAAITAGTNGAVWVPAGLRMLAPVMRLTPRPLWRRQAR
jgi:decaprenylphospho-beta-D-erythro-pentofuranosid-2-ulose 2-reductase